MSRVSRRDCQVSRLRDSGNEHVIERSMIANPVCRKDSRGPKVEWQHSVGKCWQDVHFDPATQHRSPPRIGSLLRHDAPLNLCDARSRYELISEWDGHCPGFDCRGAALRSQRGHTDITRIVVTACYQACRKALPHVRRKRTR